MPKTDVDEAAHELTLTAASFLRTTADAGHHVPFMDGETLQLITLAYQIVHLDGRDVEPDIVQLADDAFQAIADREYREAQADERAATRAL
jgi:hypothetical protein